MVDLGAGQFDKLQFVPPMARKWGIELFPGYLAFAEQGLGINVRFGDLLEWERHIPETDRDFAMLIDSLEHVGKDDGTRLLKGLQQFFRKIIVFTPLGFHPQEEDETGFDNQFQKHECGWVPEELEALGFTTVVDDEFHGPKGGAIFAVWERS